MIARLQGYVFGVGFELALACDFRVAADDVQLALPEATIGMIPGSGGTQRLARMVGLGRAKDIVMRGRRVGADEALALGLVTEVVPAAELDARGAALLDELSRHSPLALAMAKRVLNTRLRRAARTSGSRSRGSPTACSSRRTTSARASRRSARSASPSSPGSDAVDTRDLALRNLTYALFVELGRAPSAEEVAGRACTTEEDIRRGLAAAPRRARGRARCRTGELRMANPFSAVPTAYRVHAVDRWWYANCAWDAFGICAALHADGTIEASCADCGEPLRVEVRDGRADDESLVFHCLVPAAQWWDDIVFT